VSGPSDPLIVLNFSSMQAVPLRSVRFRLPPVSGVFPFVENSCTVRTLERWTLCPALSHAIPLPESGLPVQRRSKAPPWESMRSVNEFSLTARRSTKS